MKANSVFTGLFFILFSIQCAKCLATITESADVSSRISGGKKRTCNTNVCFVIDGTTDISPDYFHDQKRIIVNVVRLLKKTKGTKMYAAVEYGISTYIIALFTDKVNEFIDIIWKATQSKSRQPFLTGGINYCYSLLDRQATGDKVIVIIGSGRNTIGASPIDRADLFVKEGGKIIPVGVGDNQDKSTLVALAGDEDGISVTVPRRIWQSAKDTADLICP